MVEYQARLSFFNTFRSAILAAEAVAAGARDSSDAVARLTADLRVRDAAVAAAQEEVRGREEQLESLRSLLEAVTVQRAGEVASLVAQLEVLQSERDAALANATAAMAQLRELQQQRPLLQLAAGDGTDLQHMPVILHQPAASPSLSRSLDEARVRIATLQARTHELRAALADAQARTLDASSHAVDRRVVGQLLLVFLRVQRESGRWAGHASPRSRDALAVLAAMLGLTAAEREAVGCDDEVAADPLQASQKRSCRCNAVIERL